MPIIDMLNRDHIVKDLQATGKKDVLVELAQLLAGENGPLNNETVVNVLLEREKLGSTGIGEGIAIPHGKLAGIERIFVGFGRSRAGVDFDSLDGRPVHLFFLIVAPEWSSGQHLKVLAKISRMLKDRAFRERLIEAETVDDLYTVIEEMDRQVL